MFQQRRSSTDPGAAAKSGRGKRWLFRAMTLLLVFGAVELISFFGLKVVRRDGTLSDIRQRQTDTAEYAVFHAKPSEAIHPYLGWVLNPDQSVGKPVNNQIIPVNAQGFEDHEFGELRRSEDRVIIAILGGSVAWQMSAFGEQRMRQALAAHPRFAGKEIVLVRLALSGYKQPQQLLALNYLLALGAEFDFVVNVDGYNEIALPAAENFNEGVNVSYPRAWRVLMVNVVDPRESDAAFRVLEAKAKRQRLAAAAVDSPLNWSCTYNLIWYVRDMSLHNSLVEFELEYRRNVETRGRGFQAVGPVDDFHTEAELFAALTELWRNSSLQLHRLSESNGAVYIHVLQPNQYVPDSKPLSGFERDNCIVPGQEYGEAVVRGYPLLIEAGRELESAGVRFHDATLLFTNVEADIYADCFCHYNQRGNDMLAETVAHLLIDADQPGRAVESDTEPGSGDAVLESDVSGT